MSSPPTATPHISNNKKSMSMAAPAAPAASSYDVFSEEKYKQLKRKLREIMEVNESMSKEYGRAKKKIRTLAFERNLLLDNIARMENVGHSSDDNSSDVPSNISDTESELDEVPSKTIRRRVTPQPSTSSSPIESPTRNASRDVATVASAPPKRSKISRITVKTRRVQPIDRDENGQPKLPQQIGVLTVQSLGRIVSDRDTFHNERYIFPVGYSVSRTYPSMIDPHSNTVITSTILDGGDGPRFHVVAADMPDKPIIANSATGAWTVVVRRSNEIRHREHSNSASGPDYYGFKHPTIAKLIQDLPGTDNLKHYVWQSFEEMEPRAAKGVMAAAEKKRGNLEQMGNANRRAPRQDGDGYSQGIEEVVHHDLAPTGSRMKNLLVAETSDGMYGEGFDVGGGADEVGGSSARESAVFDEDEDEDEEDEDEEVDQLGASDVE